MESPSIKSDRKTFDLSCTYFGVFLDTRGAQFYSEIFVKGTSISKTSISAFNTVEVDIILLYKRIMASRARQTQNDDLRPSSLP